MNAVSFFGPHFLALIFSGLKASIFGLFKVFKCLECTEKLRLGHLYS